MRDVADPGPPDPEPPDQVEVLEEIEQRIGELGTAITRLPGIVFKYVIVYYVLKALVLWLAPRL